MSIHGERFPPRTVLIGSPTGELEMNFGEYEFVYPDGEIDTTPTSGESSWNLRTYTTSTNRSN